MKIFLLGFFILPIAAMAQWTTANNKLYSLNDGVGIGTQNPSTRFEIIKASNHNYSFRYARRFEW